MSLIAQLKNKQVLVLGLGITGLSCVRYLTKQGINFTVNDSRSCPVDSKWFKQAYPDIKLVTSKWDNNLIAQADIIIVSPGIDLKQPDIAEHLTEQCQILGDVELFFQVLTEHKKQPDVIAVTGSNGKSTVVSLLVHMANKLNIKAQLAGNIGVPVLDTLNNVLADKTRCLILELSSFQLETLHSMRATAATVLNVSDDHLDRHIDLITYQSIKHHIYKQAHHIIFNRDDALTYPKKVQNYQDITSFGSDTAAADEFGLADSPQGLQLMLGSQALLPLTKLPLTGIHNALNCLAALALGRKLGWNINAMIDALITFKGLAHRCEQIASNDDIIWINDSKATNVGATLAAIEGLALVKNRDQKLILIAGGDGKGADFSPLKKVINDDVDLLITLGKDGDKLASLKTNTQSVASLAQAVKQAKQHAQAGDIILLSPACASIDMFKNFAERGELFVQEIRMNNRRKTTQEVGYD